METDSKGVDVQAQAGAGRACGYGREKDTYPIYCDLESVEEAIELYEDLGADRVKKIPAGRQNYSSDRCGRGRLTFEVLKIVSLPEAKAIVSPIRKREKLAGKTGNAAQISYTSGNVVNDVAALCLRGKRDNGSTHGYYLDGPPTRERVEKILTSSRTKAATRRKYGTKEARDARYKELVSSFEAAMKRFGPSARNKVVLFDLENPIRDTPLKSRDELQRRSSSLRKEDC